MGSETHNWQILLICIVIAEISTISQFTRQLNNI